MPNQVRFLAPALFSLEEERKNRSRKPPNPVQVTLALGTVPINRYSFETMEVLRESVKQWETEWNE